MASHPQPDHPEAASSSAPNANGVDPTASAVAPTAPTPALPDGKLPTRKDASLKEFLSKMDDYAPIVSLLPNLSHSLNLHLTSVRYPTQSLITT